MRDRRGFADSLTGKATWYGCGNHVEKVLNDLKAENKPICDCKNKGTLSPLIPSLVHPVSFSFFREVAPMLTLLTVTVKGVEVPPMGPEPSSLKPSNKSNQSTD